MSSDVDGSVIVPSSSSVTRPSLPSTGSRWERFPCFAGTTNDSDSSRDRSASPQARRPTSIGRVLVRSWSSRHEGSPKPGLDHGYPARRRFRWRPRGLPSSWGAFAYMLRDSDPGGSRRSGLHGRRDVAFHLCEGVGWHTVSRVHSHIQRFRGSIPQPAHSLSTLRRDGHPPPRKTRFRLGASRDRTGLEPAGLQMRFRE